MLKKIILLFLPLAIIVAFVGLQKMFETNEISRPLAAGQMTTRLNTDVPGLETLTGEALAKEQQLHEKFVREAAEEAARVGERKAEFENARANSNVQDPRRIHALPISTARNRVTAKSVAIVCPSLVDFERALNLHNARRADLALGLGCRYLIEGEQGVRLQQAGKMQEILFDTAQGSRSYWGYVPHFVWEP